MPSTKSQLRVDLGGERGGSVEEFEGGRAAPTPLMISSSAERPCSSSMLAATMRPSCSRQLADPMLIGDQQIAGLAQAGEKLRQWRQVNAGERAAEIRHRCGTRHENAAGSL